MDSYGPENGLALDRFIEGLMLQPHREPVASELGGADVSDNYGAKRPYAPSTQPSSPSTITPFAYGIRLKIFSNIMTDITRPQFATRSRCRENHYDC
jgi:hypothetical protein